MFCARSLPGRNLVAQTAMWGSFSYFIAVDHCVDHNSSLSLPNLCLSQGDRGSVGPPGPPGVKGSMVRSKSAFSCSCCCLSLCPRELGLWVCMRIAKSFLSL